MQGKRSAIFLSFLLTAILFTLLTPVHAQLGTVYGTIVDEEGNPLEGVEIEIQGLEVKRTYRVKTKKDGKYVHAGVQLQGTYRIVVKKEGYQPDYAQGIRPGFGTRDERGKFDFVLKKGGGGTLAFEMSAEEVEKLKAERADQEKKAHEFEAMKASFDQGVELYGAGNYEGALAAFQTASEKDASQAAVWAYLGNTYSKLDRYEDGIVSYEKAIELSPEDAGLYQNLGNLYASTGNTDKAKSVYEKAAELSAATDPTAAATTYYNMGVTYINNGQTQEAADALNKAVEADPAHAEAHYQLGLTLLGLNQMEDSVLHLKKYLELAPAGPNAETAKALVEQLGG